MTRIVRLSLTEFEKETGIKDVLGFSRPSTDEFLLRDDLARDTEKQILAAQVQVFDFLQQLGASLLCVQHDRPLAGL